MMSGPRLGTLVRRVGGRSAGWNATLGLVAVLIAACSGAPGTGAKLLGSPAPGVPPPSNTAAPAFAFTTFEGRRLSLADFKGKAVVLNFWASWCSPCRAEMPYFETTYRVYRERDVVFLGLAVRDDPEASRAFLEEFDVTYPTGPDENNEIAQRYQLYGLPLTVFITRDAKVAWKWPGAISEQRLVALIAEIAR